MAEETSIERKILGLQNRVLTFSLFLCLAILSIGFIGWQSFWWGAVIGFAMGVFSFHILVTTVGGLTGDKKAALVKGLVLSMGKIGFLFVALMALNYFGVPLIQVLGGLLFSQVAVVLATVQILRTPPSGGENGRT